MTTVAFDTATPLLSIALEHNGKTLYREWDSGFRHGEKLILEIDNMLKELSLSKNEIDLIVCSLGPGSFTGLRVGMATAKGMALALNKPWVAVSNIQAKALQKKEFRGVIVPVIDAKKKRFFASLYERGELLKKETSLLDIAPLELFETVKKENKPFLFSGYDAPLFLERLKEEDNSLSVDTSKLLNPNYKKGVAEELIFLGKLRFNENGSEKDDLGPIYGRLSDAEISMKEKLKGNL